jgi:hypothetical protein
MIELTAAFVVGWMTRPLWDLLIKPFLNLVIKAYIKEKKHD